MAQEIIRKNKLGKTIQDSNYGQGYAWAFEGEGDPSTGSDAEIKSLNDINAPIGSRFLDLVTGTHYIKYDTTPNENGGKYKVGAWKAHAHDDEVSNTVINNTSTGTLMGCVLSIDGGATEFSISAGNGVVVDNYTDPNNPTISAATYSGGTGITPIGAGLSPVTFLLIDKDGVLTQQFTPVTSGQRRDNWWVGFVIHISGTTITDVGGSPSTVTDVNLSAVDLQVAMGLVASGLTFSANGANAFLDRAAGSYAFTDINFYNDRKSPNIKTFPAATNVAWTYSYKDGSSDYTRVENQTSVDFGNYDNGTGTLSSVSTNSWTVQKIFMFSNGSISISYGQETYNNFTDALADLSSDPDIDPFLADDTQRGYLILRGGGSNLSNSGDAVFRRTGRFGFVG
jgi:hypothetical protein